MQRPSNAQIKWSQNWIVLQKICLAKDHWWGSVSEMRIWAILLIKSQLKIVYTMYILVEVSLYSNCNWDSDAIKSYKLTEVDRRIWLHLDPYVMTMTCWLHRLLFFLNSVLMKNVCSIFYKNVGNTVFFRKHIFFTKLQYNIANIFMLFFNYNCRWFKIFKYNYVSINTCLCIMYIMLHY